MIEVTVRTDVVTEEALRSLLTKFPFDRYDDPKGMREGAERIIQWHVDNLDRIKDRQSFGSGGAAEYKLALLWSMKHGQLKLRCHL